MARPTFVRPGAPRVGACLWERLVLTTSEAFCRWGPNHTALVRGERASDGGRAPETISTAGGGRS